jgi:hypothetical protein
MAVLPVNADFNAGLSLYPFTLKSCRRAFIGKKGVRQGFTSNGF